MIPSYDELPKAAGGVGSAWRLFGPDDSVGLMNLQTPERVAAAARLVKRGAVFSLNAPIDVIDPAFFGRGTPRHSVYEIARGRGLDDVIDNFYPQASSQWDSLAHANAGEGVFYNGASVADIRAGRDTIDHWARRGIAGRAVVLDVERACAEAGLPYRHGSAHPITVADLELARKRAGVSYQPGDVLLMHTGFLAWYVALDASAKAALAPRTALQAIGIERSEAMARYLWDAHACALAGDNPGIEVWPGDPKETGPFAFLHHVLIGQFGLALGELWELGALAADCARDGVYEMFFTSAPLHIRGGIGSPANALAIK